jgi:hypothetical protein
MIPLSEHLLLGALPEGLDSLEPFMVLGGWRRDSKAYPCVQTRIGTDSRQITKRRQGAQLRVPPASSFRGRRKSTLCSRSGN